MSTDSASIGPRSRKLYRPLVVANPSPDSESDSDRGTNPTRPFANQRQFHDHPYSHHPLPSPTTRSPPLDLPTHSSSSYREPGPLNTTNLPHHSRYPASRSNPALSSPSGTSSPPPSTPGQSFPPVDIAGDGALHQEAIIGPSNSSDALLQHSYGAQPAPCRTGNIFSKLKSHMPQRHAHDRRLSSGSRPATSPVSATVSEAYSGRGPRDIRSPQEDKTNILVTGDSEQYYMVDISGFRDTAFIRELIFSKLRISDEEQSQYSIYRTEIGAYALGDALKDDQLFNLCSEHGDPRGTLKFLVANSSAVVHEPSQASPVASPTASAVPPPVLPSTSRYPLRHPHRSQSRHGSVSSASERVPADASNGYDPSVSDDAEGPDESHRSTLRPPPRNTQNPGTPSARRPTAPRQPSPEPRSPSPAVFLSPDRPQPTPGRLERGHPNVMAAKHAHGRPSPDPSRNSFDEDGPPLQSRPWAPHVRSGSDAADKREQVLKETESMLDIVTRRKQSHGSDKAKRRPSMKKEPWVVVDNPSPSQENGRSRNVKSPRYTPSTPFFSPRMQQPPPTPPGVDRPSRGPGRNAVPAGWAVKWQPRELSSTKAPQTPYPLLKSARSMESLRDRSHHPGVLTPGGQRPSVPPLPPVPQTASYRDGITTPSSGYISGDSSSKSLRHDASVNAPTQSPETPKTAFKQGGYPSPTTQRPPRRPLPPQGQAQSPPDPYSPFTPSANRLPPSSSTASSSTAPAPGSSFHPPPQDPHPRPSSLGDEVPPPPPPPPHITRTVNVSVFAQPIQETDTARSPSSQTPTPLYPVRQLPLTHHDFPPPSTSTRVLPLPPLPTSRVPSTGDHSDTNGASDAGMHYVRRISPPRSPVSPRSPQNEARSPYGPFLTPSLSTGTFAESLRSPMRDTTFDSTISSEEQARVLSMLQAQLDAGGGDNTMVQTIRHKESFILPQIPPPPPLPPTLRSPPGYVPPPPALIPLPPVPATAPPPMASLDTPSTPDSQNSDHDSDSERDSIWQIPMDDDDSGTLWAKQPMPPRPRSNRGPPLTVKIEPGSSSSSPQKISGGGGYTTLIPANFPPPPRDPPPSPPRAAWGGRTPTARQQPERKSSTPDSSWASRPNPEEVIDRLEHYFPDHDLDKPVIEASSGGTSPTAVDYPSVLQPQAVANVSAQEKRRHKKSIRVVAEEHKQRISRVSRGQASAMSNVMRKRSTKLWDSRVEEVTPGQIKAGMASITPDSPGTGSAAARKPIFKWVRGELIGKGNFGRVYLAMNVTTGEMIAVKQVEIPRTASDMSDTRQVNVVEALKLESETLKDLDHPNIVQYLGFEETPTFLSIFLEYVPGGSVGSCLRKYGRFDEDVTKSFSAQILSGLEYLHSKGILHRDLKADNILVEQSGVCKISDFGISKRTDDINGQNVLTAMQGTVFWMAPEVVNTGKGGYNAKVDIWSVGCVVLEMWAGERPWRKEEAMAVIVKLYSSKQAPPIPSGITLSPQADDFRKKCFAVNPDERPSAAELRKHPYLTVPPGWTFTGFSHHEIAKEDSDF
ncbi:hypothetical protein OF83DRAFT_1105241 [Amylostereum chailletii]|nr:hypothetical protein OF83DRAFT_1105241 [Amylostereum chailletii]